MKGGKRFPRGLFNGEERKIENIFKVKLFLNIHDGKIRKIKSNILKKIEEFQ